MNLGGFRNFELCSLQGRHYTQDCAGPSPYYTPFDEINLTERKGYLNKVEKDESALEGDFYMSNSAQLCLHIRTGRQHVRNI